MHFLLIPFPTFHFCQGLPPAMQKVMYKGLVPEDKTLREIKVTSGAKIMVVGSTINDVLAVNTPKDAAQQDTKAEENKKEPLCRQKVSALWTYLLVLGSRRLVTFSLE